MELRVSTDQLAFLYITQSLSWTALFLTVSGYPQLTPAVMCWLTYPAIFYIARAIRWCTRSLATTIALVFAAWVSGLAIYMTSGGSDIAVYTAALPIALTIDVLGNAVAESPRGRNIAMVVALPIVFGFLCSLLYVASISLILGLY